MGNGLVHAGRPGAYLAMGLSEYKLLARPERALMEKLQQEQDSLPEDCKEYFISNWNFTIEIAAFRVKEYMEETLIRWLHRIAGDMECFQVMLNNYSGIPPHTLYLRVQDHEPFRQIHRRMDVIDQYIRLNNCPPVQFNWRPHLPLAASLPEPLYEKLMPLYARQTFCDCFEMKEWQLVKKIHAFDGEKRVARFGLQPSKGNN